MDETVVMEVVFAADAEMAEIREAQAYEANAQAVESHNIEAMKVDVETLNAFLELITACDADYIDTQDYEVEAPQPMLDWDSVSKALDESQRILIGVQELLSSTLAEMGVADHEHIRVYSDDMGFLHLLVDHPLQEEIEAALNSETHRPLRELYQAATSGMSMAGGLVGRFAVPDAVVEHARYKRVGVEAGVA
jgi:hypothetical protein